MFVNNYLTWGFLPQHSIHSVINECSARKYQCIDVHKECGKEFIGCQLKLPQQHFPLVKVWFLLHVIPVTAYIAIVVAGKTLSNSVYTPPPRRRAPLIGLIHAENLRNESRLCNAPAKEAARSRGAT